MPPLLVMTPYAFPHVAGAALLVLLGVMETPVSSVGMSSVARPAITGAGGWDAAGTGDADHDGVPDAHDFCPDTPAGYPVDEQGCALDSDGDGVADGADRCPSTRRSSRGIDETVDVNGCSVRDLKKERLFVYSVGLG